MKIKTKQKRKYTKRAAKWKVKSLGKDGKIVAAYTWDKPTLPPSFDISPPTASIAPPTWTDKPQEPGLHVMRTEFGTGFGYTTVRAVLTNNGITECYKINTASSDEYTIDMSLQTRPNFQKVKE